MRDGSDAADTATVRFQVRQLEHLHGCGRLLALAVVAVDLDGLEMTLEGVRVVRGTDGIPAVHPPAWRHPGSGKWHPGVHLPEEVARGIGEEVLRAFADPGGSHGFGK